jgi:uncharacterized protein
LVLLDEMLRLNEEDMNAIRGLVLENAFTNIPEMIKAVYPNKWLPYRYLGPLVMDKWDALGASKRLGKELRKKGKRLDILVLISEKDELVPREMGEKLWGNLTVGENAEIDEQKKEREKEIETDVGRMKLVLIKDALHDTAYLRRGWKENIIKFLEQERGNGK